MMNTCHLPEWVYLIILTKLNFIQSEVACLIEATVRTTFKITHINWPAESMASIEGRAVSHIWILSLYYISKSHTILTLKYFLSFIIIGSKM